MTDTIRVTRGEDVADIRPEWLEEWRGWGWTAEIASDPQDTDADTTKPGTEGDADATKATAKGGKAKAE